MDVIASGVFVGVIATLVLDLWALIARSLLSLPATNWRFVGRWLLHMQHGVFVQPAIANAASMPGEHAAGWLFHYAIGIVYGIVYLLLLKAYPGSPALVVAVLLAWLLLAAPWCVMQPGLGMGGLRPQDGDTVAISRDEFSRAFVLRRGTLSRRRRAQCSARNLKCSR